MSNRDVAVKKSWEVRHLLLRFQLIGTFWTTHWSAWLSGAFYVYARFDEEKSNLRFAYAPLPQSSSFSSEPVERS